MKKLRKLLGDRRGISMTEVVVAMAVVIIVTGAAISLLIASMQFDSKYNAQTQALNACESAVHCLRFTEDETELEAYLTKLGFTADGGRYILQDGKVTVASIDGKWTVTLDDEIIYEKS